MPRDPVLAAFERRVAAASGAPLVVSARRRASRAEIAEMARHIAASASAVELGPGSLVGLAAVNGAGFLAGLLGLRQCGCAVLLLDASAPGEKVRQVAAELGCAAWLAVATPWPEPGDLRLNLLSNEAADPEAASAGGRRRAELEDVAVVKLTSGSTGAPRGISASAAAIAADDRALAASMRLAADEHILAAVPMSHSYGLSSVALPALMRGSVLVVPEPGGPLAAIDAARDGGVTFLPTVPAYLQALLKLAKPPPWPRALRLLVTAGAPLPPVTARAVRERYGRPVQVFYGASECGGISFDREGGAGERGTLGTPVDGVEIELEPVDGAGPGEGMVCVRSPAVAGGYLPAADDRLSGGRFVTADLGAFRDGELVLLGRTDDWINVKGKKVNPRELEAVLSTLRGVEEVAVLGVPADAGESVRAVVACSPGAALDLDGVRRSCRGRLAEHQLPRSLVIVDELPRTSRGKLDREALSNLSPTA